MRLHATWIAVAGLAIGAGCGASDDPTAADPTETPEVSSQLTADLVFLREEEKLARDTYLKLNETWASTVLENIAGSEQQHMDAVKVLLVTYGITDPVAQDVAGEFASQELAGLYADLVEKGLVSETEAMLVGATIEDLDIRDIEVMTLHTQQLDVLATLASLACGSRNHMRGFVARLEQVGVTYQPQYISQEAFDQIVSSAKEQCSPSQ